MLHFLILLTLELFLAPGIKQELRDMWLGSVSSRLEDARCVFGTTEPLFITRIEKMPIKPKAETVGYDARACREKVDYLGIIHTHWDGNAQNSNIYCAFSIRDKVDFERDIFARYDFVLCAAGIGYWDRSYIPQQKVIFWRAD